MPDNACIQPTAFRQMIANLRQIGDALRLPNADLDAFRELDFGSRCDDAEQKTTKPRLALGL
jgi:hypothetical protein